MGLQSIFIANDDSALVAIASSHQELAVSSTAVQLDATKLTGRYALVSVTGAAIMVTFDGTTPTASKGIYMAAGATAMWKQERAKAAKFIRVTSTDGKVDCEAMTAG